MGEWRGLSLTVRRQDWEGKCDGLDIPWETPTQKMCDATGEARGLPEEFRRAVTQLPPVTEILRSTEARSSDLNETNLSREHTLPRGFYKRTAILHTGCEIKALRRTIR